MQNNISYALNLISKGGLVVYPTDTLYGLGAHALKKMAVERVYAVKRRPKHIPIPILVHSVNEIDTYATMSPLARCLTESFLPGPLTIVLPKKSVIPDNISVHTVAIRVSSNSTACELSKKFPITATSANIHGYAAPNTAQDARQQLGDHVDFYLDEGPTSGSASTVVEILEDNIRILRQGTIKRDDIYECIRRL